MSTMEEIASLWAFQESMEDLKQKLEYTAYELELTKKAASEELKRNNDQINKLLQLVQTAMKERDEAKSQLTKLQNSLSFNQAINNIDHQLFSPTPYSPDTPLLHSNNTYPTKSNSFTTDSTTNPQSPVVDSTSYPCSPDSSGTVDDHGSMIIAKLAKGRPLPEKGSLMQAVKDAGPILETLMVAGALPRWRNPPGQLPSPIPPVNINSSGYFPTTTTSSLYGQTWTASTAYFSISPTNNSSVLDFGAGNGNSVMMPAGLSFGQACKRQRLV